MESHFHHLKYQNNFGYYLVKDKRKPEHPEKPVWSDDMLLDEDKFRRFSALRATYASVEKGYINALDEYEKLKLQRHEEFKIDLRNEAAMRFDSNNPLFLHPEVSDAIFDRMWERYGEEGHLKVIYKYLEECAFLDKIFNLISKYYEVKEVSPASPSSNIQNNV